MFCILVFITELSFVALTGCAQEKPYHRIQTSRITDAKNAMGGGGIVGILVETEHGLRIEAELSFQNRVVTDEKLEHLRGVDGIIGIDLSGTKVTDSGLAVLATLPDLRYLKLADTHVTSEGLKAIATVRGLRRLDLRRTNIDASASNILATFPALKVVYAKGTGLKSIEGVRVNNQDELDGSGGNYWDEGAGELDK